MAIFRLQVHFSRGDSATKFIKVKTVSVKFVRHSLAYLSVQKWLVGYVPWLKVSPVSARANASTEEILRRSYLHRNDYNAVENLGYNNAY